MVLHPRQFLTSYSAPTCQEPREIREIRNIGTNHSSNLPDLLKFLKFLGSWTQGKPRKLGIMRSEYDTEEDQ